MFPAAETTGSLALAQGYYFWVKGSDGETPERWGKVLVDFINRSDTSLNGTELMASQQSQPCSYVLWVRLRLLQINRNSKVVLTLELLQINRNSKVVLTLELLQINKNSKVVLTWELLQINKNSKVVLTLELLQN